MAAHRVLSSSHIGHFLLRLVLECGNDGTTGTNHTDAGFTTVLMTTSALFCFLYVHILSLSSKSDPPKKCYFAAVSVCQASWNQNSCLFLPEDKELQFKLFFTAKRVNNKYFTFIFIGSTDFFLSPLDFQPRTVRCVQVSCSGDALQRLHQSQPTTL